MSSKTKQILILLGLFLAIFFYYDYATIFQIGPCSTHQWRQTDGATFALNYSQDGMNFFKPRMHYVLSGEGYTVGEFPIIYYLSAVLYKIFGAHDGLFRTLNLSIFLIGLIALSRLTFHLSKDLFFATAIPLLLMGAPLLAFYSFNFVPNPPALGLVFIAWYFFYQFYISQKNKFFYFSMISFSMAGLLKIPALITYVAIGAIYLMEFFNFYSFKNKSKIFEHKWQVAPGFLLVLFTVYGWKIWADHYNEINHTSYFLAGLKPIWAIGGEQISYTYSRVLHYWSSAYYNIATHITIVLLSIVFAFTPRKQNSFFYATFWLFIIGSLIYGMLWYQQFKDHDYYTIELYIFPTLIFLMTGLFLKNHFPKVLKHLAFRIGLAVFVLVNIHHAKSHLIDRYNPEGVFMNYIDKAFYKKKELHSFLKKNGIQPTDKVVSIPDMSPNNTLYHLNLRGWTELYQQGSMPASKVKEHALSGAKYLIIGKREYLQHKNLQAALIHPIDSFEHSIFVFDIQHFLEK